MLFLLLLVPASLLGAILAWETWRVRRRRLALALAGVSLVCSVLSLGIVIAGILFYETLRLAGAG